VKADEAQDNDRPFFLGVYDGLPGATPAQQQAVTDALASYSGAAKKEADARNALSLAIVLGEASETDLGAKIDALAAASLELANARLAAMQKLQSGPQKLSPRQMRVVQQATAGGGGGFGGPAAGLTGSKQAKINAINAGIAELATKDGTARAALTSASFSGASSELSVDVEATKAADMQYALAASSKFSELAHSADKLTAAEQTQLARTMGVRAAPQATRRAPAGPDPIAERVAAILKQYLSPEVLKNYDAVAFLSTTGELPLPDSDAFFKWIADGHGFVGLHSATDTLHKSPQYIDMIGGEFQTHGMFQPKIPVFNVDPKSPLTAGWGNSVALNEEFYLIKNFDPKKVHMLLELYQQPYTGAAEVIPVSWIKSYGKGRVFYTSLGHRDDVLFDAPIGDQEFKKRYNDASVAKAVDEHILNGIRFALGLLPADTTPQAH
jgi:type 1 glutamine amidotransferase